MLMQCNVLGLPLKLIQKAKSSEKVTIKFATLTEKKENFNVLFLFMNVITDS